MWFWNNLEIIWFDQNQSRGKSNKGQGVSLSQYQIYFFLETRSQICQGWPQTYYAAQVGLELTEILLPPTKCLDFWCELPVQALESLFRKLDRLSVISSYNTLHYACWLCYWAGSHVWAVYLHETKNIMFNRPIKDRLK